MAVVAAAAAAHHGNDCKAAPGRPRGRRSMHACGRGVSAAAVKGWCGVAAARAGAMSVRRRGRCSGDVGSRC